MALTDTKIVNGMVWPADDVDCAAVTFGQVGDLTHAIQHCKDRWIAIQAGGNAGLWPKHLAQHFQKVYTFEPEPDNYHCLEINCKGLNVYTMPMALGRASGRGVALEYPEGRRNLGATRVAGYGEIPMYAIDDLSLIACDLIQLDIEGFEPEAIKGALQTIRKYRPVLMLEDKGLSVKYGYPQGWWQSLIVPLGYRLATQINRDVILVPEET